MATSLPRYRGDRWALAALMLASAAILALPAQVAAQGNARGAELLRSVESGQRNCDDLKSANIEQMGEYVMGRMVGSLRAHEAMDRFMSTMMGTGAERRMHEAMGRRFAGCGGAGLPAGFGPMMGAVNGMGMMGAGMMGGINQAGGRGFYGGPGMMGGSNGVRGSGSYGRPGPMMGGYALGTRASNDNDDGPSAAAMLGVMAVLIGAVALALVWLWPRRVSSGPLELLQQRYARGELSADQYQDSKRLLEGG